MYLSFYFLFSDFDELSEDSESEQDINEPNRLESRIQFGARIGRSPARIQPGISAQNNNLNVDPIDAEIPLKPLSVDTDIDKTRSTNQDDQSNSNNASVSSPFLRSH